MSADPRAEAALGLYRFGLGPRAGTINAIASDPRGALLADLERPAAGLIRDADLRTTGEAARAVFAFRRERVAAAKAQSAQPAMAAAQDAGGAMANAPGMEAGKPPAAAPPPNPAPNVPQQILADEIRARIRAALTCEIGFVERLTWFWSNHFCISSAKNDMVRAMAGPFEREAIRAHVLGRFADMLLAVESHPAMLLYLDNTASIGPNSSVGKQRRRGLNENLAREILELHTLGVRSDYTQDDVTSFAKVITGWTMVSFRQDRDNAGAFTFNETMHEPGAHTVVGKTYGEGGVAQGRAVLADLARHPATATHVATKLVRHFVSDEPPPALVARIARRFRDTDGDLKEVAKALVDSPEAWTTPRGKLKRPSEWIASVLRAGGVTPPEGGPVIQAQNLLGEPIWRPPAPKGFSDDSADWVDGLSQRLDIANQMTRRTLGLVDPLAMADAALGPLVSAETRQALERAASRPQAMALLLMAPEFQRR